MADIDIERTHTLGRADGRTAVARVANQLQDDLGLQCKWNGNTLRFEGSGAEGHIEVQDDRIRVAIDLSWMLSPMQHRIRQETEQYLDRHLGPED
jgi:putative polyhydroxyalkanoate system protein